MAGNVAVPLYQQVKEDIKAAIEQGKYKPKEKIPTEPELSAALGVARSSVREATKILTYLGVLESRRSEGTFVTSGFQESMIDPMVYGIILNQGEDFNSLIELRELTEVGILRLAMKKSSAEELEGIREKLEIFEEAAAGKQGGSVLEKAFQADNDFHDAVSSLCQNDLVDKINRVVRVLTYAVRQKTVYTMIQTGRGQELLQAHWKIYEILYTKNMEGLEEFIHDTYFLDVASENK